MAYALHTNIITTVFWVGEEAGDENGFIPNYESAWDGDWLRNFGGIDDPAYRKGANPLLVMPRENPFYFALPYNDIGDDGFRKANALAVVPWASGNPDPEVSIVKNRWIKITANGKTAYAQWEDAGPFGEDDTAYVFGTARPANGTLTKAGLDVSPAARDYLGIGDVGATSWQFVEFSEVPDGPWKTIVTTSPGGFDSVPETPSAGADWLIGGAKTADVINGLGGDDQVFAAGKNDKVFGGLGNDRLHGGTGDDVVQGGAGNDLLAGEGGNDSLAGGEGIDTLFGGAGNDRLRGGNGADTIAGGAGRDNMTGGGGGDVFVFHLAVDSPTDVYDYISDFARGEDRLNFRPVDTNPGAAGDQGFRFRGTAEFTGTAAEVRYRLSDPAGTNKDRTHLYADVDGDGTADMRVVLVGLVQLTAADFLL